MPSKYPKDLTFLSQICISEVVKSKMKLYPILYIENLIFLNVTKADIAHICYNRLSEKSNSVIKQKARHYFLASALCEQEEGDYINLPAGNQSELGQPA